MKLMKMALAAVLIVGSGSIPVYADSKEDCAKLKIGSAVRATCEKTYGIKPAATSTAKPAVKPATKPKPTNKEDCTKLKGPAKNACESMQKSQVKTMKSYDFEKEKEAIKGQTAATNEGAAAANAEVQANATKRSKASRNEPD